MENVYPIPTPAQTALPKWIVDRDGFAVLELVLRHHQVVEVEEEEVEVEVAVEYLL